MKIDFGLVLQLLVKGVSYLELKERNKYLDQLVKLEKEHYEEYNKPIGVRSDAVLDNLEHELCLVAKAYTASTGKPNPTDKS